MNGVIRIEFQIVDGQAKIMVHAPMQNQAEKDLTIQILASAIPIVVKYESSIIKPVNGNGAIPAIQPTK